jgi:MerR family transcriptional regulator/heat shock protein HspR
VNLAGVEIILNMRRKMEQMQSEINEFVGHVRQELQRSSPESEGEGSEQALVKVAPAPIVKSPERPAEAPPAVAKARDEA